MNKKLLTRFVFISFLLIAATAFLMGNNENHENTHESSSEEIAEDASSHSVSTVETDSHEHSSTQEHAANEHGDDGGGHGADMTPLFFICISLFIGTAIRHFFKKVPIPYTVLLLLIGVGIGAIDRLGNIESLNIGNLHIPLGLVAGSIKWAGSIDPHLILYVFLPTLIFEAAFALDVHTFKKSFGNAFILAVPGIILALLITAAICMWVTSSGFGLLKWDWIVALLFGALISATDPVAVVALLKELGAGKKLQTLIESESLLNDGTAIVIFLVFFAMLTGEGAGNNAFVQFFKVSLGGILVGLIIGWIIISWIKMVFNDAMFEITVIVGAAYLTFFVAEQMHVSGVLGLVTLGLVMAGGGRTRISPEVHHFLHEFWELAAFIANTLIFLIVGVVIAQRTNFTGRDIIILLITYVNITLARAIVIGVFYPIMKKVGYGLNIKYATVAWWGGLRGAVGLALALIVAGIESIDPEIRDQILFLTAGIVFLTSTINATTTKALVEKLGITKLSIAKLSMIANNNKFLRHSSEKELDKLQSDRFMAGADWQKVKDYLPEEADESMANVQIENIGEIRKKILQKERGSYWSQFEEGLLGREAVQELSDTIDVLMDSEGNIPLSKREDLENLWQTSKFLDKMQNLPLVGKWAQNIFFNKLSISYDCAKGFVMAQEESLKLISSMAINDSDANAIEKFDQIESEINENRIQGLTFLRNLRDAFPEIYNGIETRYAIRSLLNHQQYTIERMLKQRRMEPDEAQKALEEVEEKMERLMNKPPTLKVQVPIEMLKNIPWLRNLDPKSFKKVVSYFQNRIYAVGENLVKKKKYGDDIFIIVRGTVKVMDGTNVRDILGPGSVIGEMAVLAGTPRTATVTAESPVTALRLSDSVIANLIKETPEIKKELWKIAGQRFSENILQQVAPYQSMSQKELRHWLFDGEICYYQEGTIADTKDKIAVLLSGKVSNTANESEVVEEPALLSYAQYKVATESVVFERRITGIA